MNRLQTILEHIQNRVITVSEFSVANVRIDKFQGDDIASLPFVCIYHSDTEREPIDMGRAGSSRTFQSRSAIVVEVHADQGSSGGVQAEISALSDDITTAILSDRELGGYAYYADLTSYEDTFNAESGTRVGVRQLNFVIEWQETIIN